VSERVLPHNLEAERSLLGGLLIRPDGWLEVDDAVTGEEFYRAAHRTIFEAVMALARAGSTVDYVTVRDRLAHDGTLDEVGGIAYITKLTDGVPRATNVAAYADVVREKARLRALIAEGVQLVESAYAAIDESTALLEAHEQQIRKIGAGLGDGEIQDGGALAAGVLAALQRASANRGAVTGLSTGLNRLDVLTTGLQPGELAILAARPSMGKTSFAGALAWHAAKSTEPNGQPSRVLFVSVEMPTEQIAMRLACLDARVNYQLARTGMVRPDQWDGLYQVIGELENSGLYVEDRSRTVSDVRRHARRLARTKGLSLVVLDYLQLLDPVYVKGRRTAGTRSEELAQMSGSLKALAKELRVPVVALSQLSRKCEERTDKRPMLSDLRESGALEQDADLVLFLYRDEVYHERPDNKGLAELIIAKQRNGPCANIDLYWHGEYMRFYERDES
jgi:replicative DNA helicase